MSSILGQIVSTHGHAGWPAGRRAGSARHRIDTNGCLTNHLFVLHFIVFQSPTQDMEGDAQGRRQVPHIQQPVWRCGGLHRRWA